MSNVQTILLIYILYFHFPALDAGQHIIQLSQRATQATALKWGDVTVAKSTMGAWIASLTSTGTILAVKMWLWFEKAKGVVTNTGDIEICDFMRAAETVLYYYSYEGTIYLEKMLLSGECQ